MAIQFLDTGHFALETHVEEIAIAMRNFLQKLPYNTARRILVFSIRDKFDSMRY